MVCGVMSEYILTCLERATYVSVPATFSIRDGFCCSKHIKKKKRNEMALKSRFSWSFFRILKMSGDADAIFRIGLKIKQAE